MIAKVAVLVLQWLVKQEQYIDIYAVELNTHDNQLSKYFEKRINQVKLSQIRTIN